MPKTTPRSKKAKREAVGEVMSEFSDNKLKSSSGKKVRSKKQALAIALKTAGLSKKK
jgi:hypothetical protein